MPVRAVVRERQAAGTTRVARFAAMAPVPAAVFAGATKTAEGGTGVVRDIGGFLGYR
jgi:Na+/citrate or Na+/malate symporter